MDYEAQRRYEHQKAEADQRRRDSEARMRQYQDDVRQRQRESEQRSRQQADDRRKDREERARQKRHEDAMRQNARFEEDRRREGARAASTSSNGDHGRTVRRASVGRSEATNGGSFGKLLGLMATGGLLFWGYNQIASRGDVAPQPTETPSTEYEVREKPTPTVVATPDREVVEIPVTEVSAAPNAPGKAVFDFGIDEVREAEMKALDRNKAVRWKIDGRRGFSVASSSTMSGERECRNVYSTVGPGDGDEQSPTRKFCREGGGNWVED